MHYVYDDGCLVASRNTLYASFISVVQNKLQTAFTSAGISVTPSGSFVNGLSIKLPDPSFTRGF